MIVRRARSESHEHASEAQVLQRVAQQSARITATDATTPRHEPIRPYQHGIRLADAVGPRPLAVDVVNVIADAV
jgi:hypothetical protein